MSSSSVVEGAKPRNGIAGLKHFRHDLLAGLVVSLVSLPLSSGIAIASGAPPIYGLISAIIAGLVYPFVGGSYVTIAGPAAGLAPALMVTMASLGGAGDADHVGAGYSRLLVVICMVGVIQIILASLKLARFAAIFPISVVEGMLGAIGLLIIVKSLPMFFGYTGAVHAHGFFAYLAETPSYLAGAVPQALALGLGSLVLMLALSGKAAKRIRLLQVVPPQLVAVFLGTIGGLLLGLRSVEPSLLIQVPDNPFSGFQAPDFSAVLSSPELWQAALIGVVTLTLIDGVESLATAFAIDRIDPFQRRSEPNRVLMAMGVANLVSSLAGGLTVIPGGVKSKTNIAAGGRTLWSNFVNAMCLVFFLAVAPGIVSMIPKAVLGAVLVYTGYKMCEPSIARHLAAVGREQLWMYGVTVAVTVATDLLWGIAIGTLMQLLINVLLLGEVTRKTPAGGLWYAIRGMFQSPVVERKLHDDRYELVINRPLVCFNSSQLAREFEGVPAEAKEVRLFFDRDVAMVDHTALDRLSQLISAYAARPVHMAGFEFLKPTATHDRAVRVRHHDVAQSALRPSMAQGLLVPAVAALAAIAPVLGESESEERPEKARSELVSESGAGQRRDS